MNASSVCIATTTGIKSRLPLSVAASLLVVLLALGILATLVLEPMPLAAHASLPALLDAASGLHLSDLTEQEQFVILQLRLPRLLLAICVGALL